MRFAALSVIPNSSAVASVIGYLYEYCINNLLYGLDYHSCQDMTRHTHQQTLAAYACHMKDCRGRLFDENESPGRSPFQRDRDRIIHSTAFRRLEYKTQVFVNHEGDHYRTRLTHSLEVAQLSRSIARELSVDEDLSEAVALAHDFGHTPFGHAGERALHDVMKDFGGFDHNAQTLHILTKLEAKYADFDGLNLTWECLEGAAKHNGPLVDAKGKGKLPKIIEEYNKKHDLWLHTWPGVEAQISALSDDIAYNNHDMEDGIRAGLFGLSDIVDLPIVGEEYAKLTKKYPDLEQGRLIHEVKRHVIHRMVGDLVSETLKNIKDHKIKSADEVRNLGQATVAFSDDMEKHIKTIKDFLWEHMYYHYRVNRMTAKARKIVRDLFYFFLEEPQCLPTNWQVGCDGAGGKKTAAIVSDYIAGMTDRYATDLHRKVFDVSYRMIGEQV